MVKNNFKHSICRMCNDHCGIKVNFEDNKIVEIEGTKDHLWNRGRLCAKGRLGIDMIYAPDRILKPLKKTGNGWVEIELEEALDEIAQKIKKIKHTYGARSFGLWKGEAVGFEQQEDLARRFIHAFGSPNYFSNDSACVNGRIIGYKLTCGGYPAPDFANSKCIIVWGGNPPAAHPNMTQHILEAKKNGAKLIVVDSRLSLIARKADIFVQIRPGTDGALAHGITRALINLGAADMDFINNHTVGFEKLKNYVQAFTPEMVQNETGLEKDTLSEIVTLIAQRAPAVVNYVGNGLEHHENGVNNIRAVACITGLIGAFDVKGGSYFKDSLETQNLRLYTEIPLIHLDPIGAKEFPVLYDMVKECHTMTAMNTFINEEPYPIKGLVVTAANPLLTNPNTNKVKKAFQNLDLLVVRDLFMSETAELADYVLPAASYLERCELQYYSTLQVVGISEKLFTLPEVQSEYDFYHSMAHKLGFGDYFLWKNEEELNEWLLKPSGISVETLRSHPQGYQYKTIQYEKYKTNGKGFNSPSGKIEFTSNYLKKMGYDELPKYKSPAYCLAKNEEFPFTLMTGARKMLFLHGRYRNFKRMRTAYPNPEMEIHPIDALRLNLKNGDRVKVTSRIGSLVIQIKIKAENEILEKLVQITHGWKDANVNLITHDDIFDSIDGFPLMKSMQVNIEKVID
jgi:formate dehydrogenase (coenzyme F420) alpha subunit